MKKENFMIFNEMNLSLKTGDCCVIQPFQGRKKEIYLNWKIIDFVSTNLRSSKKAISFIEFESVKQKPFHYRLESLEDSCGNETYVFKKIVGPPFKYNGFWANEVFVDRTDKIEFDYHALNFGESTFQNQGMFMHPVLKMENLIKSDLGILIEGETGTGKSFLAKAIHEKSGKTGEFVAVNLSSYSLSLLESELFGHKKGAFTGALENKKGAFENAQDGTLFLDEVDSLPLEVQTKLLTFLDNKMYRMVGDTKEMKVRARMIFASGRSLESLVNKNLFRKDFYYRLKSGYSLKMMSLRENPELIKEACEYFIQKNRLKMTKELEDFYMTLPWQGNLRQLFSHLEKKRVLQNGNLMSFDECDEELIVGSSDITSFDSSPVMSLEDYRIAYFSKVYLFCHKNVRLTAKKLCISEKTARRLLERLNSQVHK